MKKGEAFLALLFAVFAIVFGKLGFDLYLSGRSGVGASQWPLIVCGIMMIGSILIFIQLFKIEKSEAVIIFNFSNDNGRVVLSFLILAIYFFSVVYIGFFISSVIMVLVFVSYFGKYGWYKSLAFSLAIVSVVYFVFSYLLNVPFNFGVLF